MRAPVDRGEVRFVEAALGVSAWAARVRSAAATPREGSANTPAGDAIACFFLGILALDGKLRGFAGSPEPPAEASPTAPPEPLDSRALLR